jgi:peptidoglycan/LPS O-acetylase OafA/YrhL
MSITQGSLNPISAPISKRLQNYSQKVTASLEISKPKNHLLVLDGVRAVACLAVILHHMIGHIVLPADGPGFWIPSGRIQTLLAAALDFGESGVILFFLLSSFLLFLPFAKALFFDGQWPSISRFYIRRFFRIIPGYYATLFLMILFFHPAFLHSTQRVELWEFLTFTMSAHLSAQLDGPFWTLAIEFQFYMLLPLIAWVLSLIVRRGTLRWRITKLVSCLLVLLGWGLLSRWWGLFLDSSTTSFPQNVLVMLKPYYYGEDSGKYFETFAIGMLLALIYVYTQNAPKGNFLHVKLQQWSSRMFLTGLAILAFLAIWHFYFVDVDWTIFRQTNPVFSFLDSYTKLVYQSYEQWQALCYSISYGLCMCALLYNSGRLKRPFEWPVLRWVGLMSYSLYMWHFPFLLLFLNILNSSFQGWSSSIKFISLLAWVLFVIFPISLTLYRWIEMPGIRLGEILLQKIEATKKKPPTDISNNRDLLDLNTITRPVKMEIS